MPKAIIAIPIWLLMAVPALADCVATPVHYNFRGDRVASSLQVQAGGTCLLQRSVSGSSSVVSATVSSRPSHGSARIVEAASIEYVPQPGFRGKDSFTQKICGGRTGKGCSFITYSVTVQ